MPSLASRRGRYHASSAESSYELSCDLSSDHKSTTVSRTQPGAYRNRLPVQSITGMNIFGFPAPKRDVN